MNALQKSFHFPLLILQHLRASPSLGRTPEPDTVMAGESVTEYVEAGRTNLAVVYAVVLETIHRARNAGSRGRLLNLACGPGHLALLAGRLLELSQVVGVDLSEEVLERARAHAREQGWASRACFEASDVSRLAGQAAQSADVVTFTNGAHHLFDLEAVRATLAEMERVARPDGLLVVADLVRFKDARTTDRFIELMAEPIRANGWPHLYKDFVDSMHAAWTAEELFSAIPSDTRREWHQLVPRGLPPIQLLVGLPVGRRELYLRRGLPWARGKAPLPRGLRFEWRVLRGMLATAHRRVRPVG